MTDFNPLAGSILGSAQAQHQTAVQNSKRVRILQLRPSNTALTEDQFEHQVESSEELAPVQDEPHQQSGRKRKSPSHPAEEQDTEDTHIDLQA